MSNRFACLFDLDGTMVDTDALHLRAYNAMLRPHGKQVDAAYYKTRIMGFPNEAILAEMFPNRPAEERVDMIESKETLFRSYLGRLKPTPGLLSLLHWAERNTVSCAVVTNAPRANATQMLAGLGLGERFDCLVIGDELPHGKPHPLPYQTAMLQLGASPSYAVAFEDSLSGVRAARAAGLTTFGMLTSLDEAALREAGALQTIRDFRDGGLWHWLQRRTGLPR